MNEISVPGSGSPFDAIRHVDDDGEHWSARELQPLLGYNVWRDFANAIDRARLACRNSGADPTRHFADARKIKGSGPTAADFRVTRYGAYLIAMNGDPRKPEIAAAQTYFAVKTREAEVTPARPVLPQSYAEALRELAATVEQAEEAKQQLAIAAPKAEAHDAYMKAQGALLIREVAKLLDVRESALRAFLVEEKILFTRIGPGGKVLWDVYAEHRKHFKPVVQTYERSSGTVQTYTVYARPSGVELIRRRLERRRRQVTGGEP